MNTDAIKNTNRLITDSAPILKFIERNDINKIRTENEVDWDHNVILRCDSELREVLISMNYASEIETGYLALSVRGRAFLGKLLLDIDNQLKPTQIIGDRYALEVLLAAGKNSLAFKAYDFRLGRAIVLKFFRPGRGEGIVKNITKLGKIKGDPFLIKPLDLFQHSLDGNHGHSVRIDVLVFPYIEGTTFRSYLSLERNSSPVVIQTFIEQTCLALRSLEIEGLWHGDLHPNNVIVSTDSSGQVAFRIIDVSYGADKPSDYEYPSSDIEGFKFVLHLALGELQSHLNRISLRRHLGARIFTLVEYILNDKIKSFDDIYQEVQSGMRFSSFNEKKLDFLRTKFRPPRDFGILRYEELSNPNFAFILFYPYPELFERLCEFGSATLLGHRGTGKSTYMAAMNFFPQVDNPTIDYRKSFGILFSCRQGEFRKFSGRHLPSMSFETKMRIKDILITKILRKTLNSLALGISKAKLKVPLSVRPIADLLLPRIQHSSGLMISHQLTEVESLKSTILQAEINSIDGLFSGDPMPAQSKLFDEHTLIDFFEAVRTSFSELNQTRFSVLFDDAGWANVPREVQSIICDLMASTNNIYCIKLSAEKQTFDFITTNGKPIERVHDVRVYTISDYFNIGGGFSSDKPFVEEYFRKLIGVRLKTCGFQSDDICEYLGNEAMVTDEIVARLASRTRGEPVYGGWQTVWKIADRTMRHLIEMISAIFDESKTTPERAPSIVSHHVQSRQIIRFSRDKLKGLMFLPGTIDIVGKKHSLGKMLYEFTASFGKVARYYLLSSSSSDADQSNNPRFDERLAIELDNTLNLNSDAVKILNHLIQYAVIDDEKLATSLDDGMRKPIYIFNKVYCPILRISYRRQTHWRLSSKRFETFLLNPSDFVRSDERLKRILKPETADNGRLF